MTLTVYTILGSNRARLLCELFNGLIHDRRYFAEFIRPSLLDRLEAATTFFERWHIWGGDKRKKCGGQEEDSEISFPSSCCQQLRSCVSSLLESGFVSYCVFYSMCVSSIGKKCDLHVVS
jgi:hypothetical protein